MSLLARTALEWIHILAQDRSEPCSCSGKYYQSWGESKAAICNPELVEPLKGLKRMWQHSCGTVLPAIHVVICQERLGMDPDLGTGQIRALQMRWQISC